MKILTTRVPNYMQIYFHYSTVTSACHGSGLACTCTVTIFRTLTNTQKRFFRHQNRHQNEINTVNQLQLNSFTNIHLLILWYINILCDTCITLKLNTLTDVPYQMTMGGAFVYICENLIKS